MPKRPGEPYTVDDALADARRGVAGMAPAAQTVARSGDPRQQRQIQAEQFDRIDDLQGEEELAARRRATDLNEQQRQLDAQARADEARKVRAADAAGAEITTDIESGRRTIARHDDGAPKFKPGAVGEPFAQATEQHTVYQDPQNPEHTINPFFPHGEGGAAATNTGTREVKQTWLQRYRDDRGREQDLPVETKTDTKTGENYFEKPDALGRQQRVVTGIDPKVVGLNKVEQESAKLDLRDNALQRERLAFDPRWQPVKAEFLAAEKESKEFGEKPALERRPDGSWFRVTESGKVEEIEQIAVGKHFQRKDQIAARLKQASDAYEPERARNEALTKTERDLKNQRLELAARKISITSGIPQEDGGVSKIIAAAETGLPDPDVETARAVADEPPTGEVKTPTALESFSSAFSGLQSPETLQTRSTEPGSTWLERNNNLVARVDARGSTPIVILSADGDDLRTQAALGNLGGVPVYLRDGHRMPVEEEAAWVAKVFEVGANSTADPMIGGDDASGTMGYTSGSAEYERERALREIGAAPTDIIGKMNRGELSMQFGEAIMRDLYGRSVKVDDPADPETFRKFLSEEPAAQAAWTIAQGRNDKDAQDALRGQFVNRWYAENRGMPGVTWDMQARARKIKEQRTTGDKIAEGAGGAGELGKQVVGSMAGLIAKYPAMAVLGIQQLWDPAADAALEDLKQVTGRANTNFTRNLEATRKKWFTEDGKVRLSALDRANSRLHSLIATQESANGRPERFRQDLSEALAGVTEATYQLHAMNLEDGWQVTRDDVDPNKDKALGSALLAYIETGDPAMFAAFQRRQLLDNGNRQADARMADITEGSSGLASAFTSGIYATDAEVVIELASDVLTFGTAKLVTGGGKAAALTAKAADGTAAMGRIARTQRYFTGLADDFARFGKVADSLAQPAGKVARAYNSALGVGKVGLVSGATESAEEGVMALGDPNATVGSVAHDAGIGFLAGVFLTPVFTIPAQISNTSRAAFERKKQVSDFAGWYNRTHAGSPGYTPMSTTDAEAALAMLDPGQHQALVDAHAAATAELKAATEEAADATQPARPSTRVSTDAELNAGSLDQMVDAADVQSQWQENASSRLSTAVATHIAARDAVAGNVLRAVEAAQSTKTMEAADRNRTLGLIKAATGRTELMTDAERKAVGGLKTRDGQPYFTDVKGQTVFTAAGRAEVVADQPLVGALIQTDESRALVEAAAAGDQSPTAEEVAPAPSEQPASPNGWAAADHEGTRYDRTPDGKWWSGAERADLERYAASGGRAKHAPGMPAHPEIATDLEAKFQRHSAGQNSPTPAAAQANPTPSTAPESDTTPVNAERPPATVKQTAIARQIAVDVRKSVEAAMPGIAGRVAIDPAGGSFVSGGARLDIETGNIALVVPDIAREIAVKGSARQVRDDLIETVLRHEVVHVVQAEALRRIHAESKDTRTFAEFFQAWYQDIWSQLPAEAVAAGRTAYGEESFDALASDGLRAAEIVRMLVEQTLTGEQATDLQKALHGRAPAGLLDQIKRAIAVLRDFIKSRKMPESVREHIEQLSRLYDALKAQPAEALAETALPASPPQTSTPQPPASEWTSFPPDSGTLGIPRADMPQIAADDRSALVQFLRARGIDYEQQTVAARSLKPTQAEYSDRKIADARAYTGGSRRILVSSDGHVLDGHHQWMADFEDQTETDIIRLDAPIAELLAIVPEMPSVAGGKPARRFKLDVPANVAMFRDDPVIAEIRARGGIMSKSRAKEIHDAEWWKLNRSLYDDAPKLGPAYTGLVYDPETGLNPDVMAMDLPGVDGDVGKLWEAIQSAHDTAVRAHRESTAQDTEQDRGEDFLDSISPDEGRQPVALSDLQVGDRLDIDGELTKVAKVERDEDGYLTAAVLQDGARFGRQRIEGDQVIYVEEVLRASRVSADEAIFSPPSRVDPNQRSFDFGTGRDIATPSQPALDFGRQPAPQPTPEIEAKAAPAVTSPAAKRANGIEDFGETIRGAAKERWGKLTAALNADLPDNMAEFTMARNFPEPDFAKLIAAGVPVDDAATLKALRDLIPVKPKSAWKLRQWTEVVRVIHQLASGIVSGRLTFASDEFNAIFPKYPAFARKIALYRALGFPLFTKAKDFDLKLGSFSVFNGRRYDRPTLVHYIEHKGRIQRELTAESGIEPEALAAILPRLRLILEAEEPAAAKKKQIEFGIYQDRRTMDYFIGKKGPAGVVRMQAGFTEIKAARVHLADNRAEIEARWEEMRKDPILRRESNNPRIGPDHRTGDVSPGQFAQTFGFRGVQFGNWVEQSRRQADLNEAFDALMDMATALGVPPRALALDGSLGLAFGARGHAGAKAHYEPGEVVINLTKRAGPGSLAHEWFHGLDNYFARLDRTGSTAAKALDRFITNVLHGSHIRPEVLEAFAGIRRAVGAGTFSERSHKLDEARSKPYYGTTIEKAARAFERYVVDRLATTGAETDYLVNIDKERSPAYPTDAEMASGIREAYDQLFTPSTPHLPRRASSFLAHLPGFRPRPARSARESTARDPSLAATQAGKANALGAYRALSAKKARGRLTAEEEETLLQAEISLGQVLAFDMGGDLSAVPTDLAPGFALHSSPSLEGLPSFQESSAVGRRAADLMSRGGMEKLPADESFGEDVRRFAGNARKSVVKLVRQMADAAYSAIGGHNFSNSSLDEMLEPDTFFDLVYRDGKPVAFTIHKLTRDGFKSILSGQNGTKEGVAAWKGYFKRLLAPGFYAELSGRPAEIAIERGIPRVANTDAREVTGKELRLLDDGYSYERRISGLNQPLVKTMFGVPWRINLQRTTTPTSSTSSSILSNPQETQAAPLPSDPSQGSESPSPSRATRRKASRPAGSAPRIPRLHPDSLASAPAADGEGEALRIATREVLAAISPLYRDVFAATMRKDSPAAIARRFSITEAAVGNILNQVRARIRALVAAQSAEDLAPATSDGLLIPGRPDLALSTLPEVAAVDQIRTSESVPDVQSQADVNAQAERLLEQDYTGTYDGTDHPGPRRWPLLSRRGRRGETHHRTRESGRSGEDG